MTTANGSDQPKPRLRLAAARRRRGWGQVRAAIEINGRGLRLGYPENQLRVDAHMVSRWERGVHEPKPRYIQIMCSLYELPADQLDLAPSVSRETGPAPSTSARAIAVARTVEQVESPTPTVFQHPFELGTLELARQFSMTETDMNSIDGIEDAVNRLCRAYSTTPPVQLLPRVQVRLTQVNQLVARRLTLSQTTRLSVAAGWLYLLLAALHFDLDQRETAEISRDLALRVGQDARDPDIVAWAYETVSWFAFFEGRPADALHYAQQGQRAASPNSSGRVMNTMKVAMASARLGDRVATERAIDQAAKEVAELPRPDEPDHHFVFDPPKIDYYAATAYTWLNDAESVRRHASAVIRESGNPAWNTWVPTRVSMAELDLATALVGNGELDEASDVGAGPFTRFVRHDTLLRAAELDRAIRRRYPLSKQARDFHEQLVVARRGLLLPAISPADSGNSDAVEDDDSTSDR